MIRQTLLNSAKSEACQSDTTPVFSMLNQGNSALKSPVVKLLKPTKIYLHSITLKQSILQLEENLKTPDKETVEVLNDSEYLERLEMLWGDSAEWL
ncbi:MAG: hypothetical protein QNJ18_01765 [Xenococcaceae cyanobacterium MO_167.B52]|nr:hypothetical protein [Xenococcaceae cyanobacterium MO_167.B52]